MAEGEEESGDAMLAVSASPHAALRRDHAQPINLKSEESDDDSSCTASTSSSSSPRDVPSMPDGGGLLAPSRLSADRGGVPPTTDDILKGGRGEGRGVAPSHHLQPRDRSQSPKAELDAKAQNHLNGLAGLMGLQNLAGLQNLHSHNNNNNNTPQHQSSQLLNTPLNLSINATGSMHVGNNGTTPGVVPQAPPQLLTAPQPAAMPQFILASGQLVQGIQGAQLLIPTSQGIATQTILTIPVNHVTSNQIVNLALSNGQVITTTLANLQSMAQPHHLLAPTHNTASSASPPIIPATGLSPANATLTSQLLNGHNATSATNLNNNNNMSNNNNNVNSVANGIQQLQHNHNQQPSLSSHLNNSLGHSQGQGHSQGHSQGQQQSHQQQLINALQQHQQSQQQQNTNGGSIPVQRSPNHFSNPEKSPPHPGSNGLLSNGGGATPSSSMPSSPLNTAINRLAATNSDLTITTTTTATKQPPQQPPSGATNNNYGSMQHSPQGIDLLDDSPNQPTISQSNCNMVDGINLDEIKEFAKAFKLRRLSLGLTQTQVGQALSITEGPAYSQSAICRFEKLDITPKSAQKIKPVLERWMKEAEERYKSGQNHLTEFIGVEPSKKRKRRTSFTPQALELLNAHFERNTHPSGTEITTLAHQLGYEREVIRIWFCNKRQALKNTVRMMSKGCPT